MKGIYNENDILRLIYGEIDPLCSSIEEDLNSNPDLKSFYKDAKKVHKHLGCIQYEPNPATINIILEHSGTYSSLETSH